MCKRIYPKCIYPIIEANRNFVTQYTMPKNKFSKEIDYRLIDLVESKPVLWDCTNEIYKRTDLKFAAWHEIAKQLGPNFTGAIISSRFKNMKGTFTRNLRAVKESKRSGAGTDNIHKPKWPLFERLMFLKKTCVQGDSESNIPSIQLETSDSDSSTSKFCYEMNNSSTSCTLDVPLNVYYDEALQKFMFVPHEPNLESVDSPSPRNSPSVCSDFDPTTVNSAPLPEMCSSLSRPAYISAVSSITQSPQKQINQINNPVTATNKRSSEEQLFCKRGSKMKKQTIMEEAVDALKQLCTPDQVSSPSQYEILNDSAHALAQFLETRLRSLPPENRKTCEDEILKLLTRF